MAEGPTGERTDTATSSRTHEGEMLGSYRIESRLGGGGMGEVYRAVDVRLNRSVAVKISHVPFSDRFEREARTLSSLNHPHICTLYDVGPNFLVMELIDGTTLAERIKQGPLPIDEVTRYGAEIAEALAEAHRAGIVHRDLKPQNVMLTRHGVKVLDFGIAQVVDESVITATGVVVGTPAYMAPEQKAGHATDARSDLFALGLILYEMANGRRPEAGAARQKLRSDLDSLLESLLDPDPAKRPQSADEVAARLRRMTLPGVPDSGRRRLVTIVGAVAAIVIVAIAALWWTNRAAQSQLVEVVSVAPIAASRGDKLYPSFSPDCRSIVFSWNGPNGKSAGLYVMRRAGGDPRQVTRAIGLDGETRWSPDGTRMAFIRVPRPGTLVELMVVGLNGESERKVREVQIPGGFLPSPSWMPDGESVVLSMLDPETQFASLFRVRVDDAQAPAERVLAGRTANVGSPAISPDGTWLAYTENHTLRARRLGPDGMPSGDAIEIFTEVELGPFVWLADNRTLLFLRRSTRRVTTWDSVTRSVDLVYASPVQLQSLAATGDGCDAPAVVVSVLGGQSEVWAMPVEANGTKPTGQPRVLGQGLLSPAFSPDGRWIAFGRVFESSFDLWLMDANGQRMHRLTDLHARVVREPSWSPDGRRIAFHARVLGKAELFVLDVDPDAVMATPEDAPPSVEPRRVVDVPFDLVAPQWSRDGKYLYALRNAAGRLFRVPVSGGEVENLFESDAARIHPTEDRVYYNKPGAEPPGVFSRSLVGNVRSNPEQPVITERVSPSGWTVTERGIFYFARPQLGQPDVMRFFDFGTRRTYDLGVSTRLAFSTLRVSPQGTEVLYDTSIPADGSMLMLNTRNRAR
jgi:Tol biopolymer transport system component/predicted Ser/Thr protein kinase